MPVKLRWILLATLLLPGCTLLPRPAGPPTTYYRLELSVDRLPKVSPGGHVVELAEIHAFPAYATARIAYRRDGEALGYHARHRWVESPARQLAPLLADALAASGCCRAVVLPDAGVVPDERLRIDLLRFEIDYRVQPARFRLAARLQRIDVTLQRVLASERVSFEAPLERMGPAAGVEAANRCVAELAAHAARMLAGDS